MEAVCMGDAKVNIRAREQDSGLSVEVQVACLIDQATDPNILGRTYQGWEPWVWSLPRRWMAGTVKSWVPGCCRFCYVTVSFYVADPRDSLEVSQKSLPGECVLESSKALP